VASVPSVLSALLFEHPKPDLEVSYVPELTNTPSVETESDHRSLAQKRAVHFDQTKREKQPPVAKPTPNEKPPDPVTPPEPPPPVPPVEHKQMVDQDRFAEEADNPDARYLAQKNHRAKEESRAKSTNLVRETESDSRPLSEPNENRSADIGKKNAKIAELEERRGPNKTMPRSSPTGGDEGEKQNRQIQQKSSLRMRDLASERSRDPSSGMQLPEEKGGSAPLVRAAEHGVRAAGGGAQKGGRANLTLDHHMYDAIEGFATAEKERREGARAEASHPQGRYQRYLSKLQILRSAVENFTPDVKPGNQSELGTRASPFAAYLTAMHRQIHKLWAFGFLSDLDGKSGRTPYDDKSLVTQLSIAIKSDGTLDKVGVLRSSGVMSFDAAAIDAVASAAPFPKPPAAIKSRNGKVYVDWKFYRDERACWTVGADPHILTTPASPGTQESTTQPGEGVPQPFHPRHLKEPEQEGSRNRVGEYAKWRPRNTTRGTTELRAKF
jgi:TonB family protein